MSSGKKSKPGSENSLLLKTMETEHLDFVLEIERLSSSRPYSKKLFQEEIELDVAYPQVLFLKETLIGFFDYWWVSGEVHLISLAIHPAWRGKGYGNFLVETLISQSIIKKSFRILLDVRAGNTRAIKLYQKFEFQKISVRKRYYSDNQEDAWIMERKLFSP